MSKLPCGVRTFLFALKAKQLPERPNIALQKYKGVWNYMQSQVYYKMFTVVIRSYSFIARYLI